MLGGVGSTYGWNRRRYYSGGKVVSGKFFLEFFSGYMGAGKKGKERDLDQNIAEVS